MHYSDQDIQSTEELHVREINVSLIADAVAEMCVEVNEKLSPDVEKALHEAADSETQPTPKMVLTTLEENLEIARTEHIPICQDTGMAIVFLEIGQDVHLTGGDLTEAVNAGVAKGYTEGYLRASVVGDPLERVNTKDNTPAIIHTSIVPGEKVRITVAPKGAGSENMSRMAMLKPADGAEGVRDFVLESIRLAGPNPCPPLVVGVGIGGDFELAPLLAKKALLRPLGKPAKEPHIRAMEEELLEKARELGIGPAGLGGRNGVYAVHIETYATHIAELPVAVNICCHVNRHITREI